MRNQTTYLGKSIFNLSPCHTKNAFTTSTAIVSSCCTIVGKNNHQNYRNLMLFTSLSRSSLPYSSRTTTTTSSPFYSSTSSSSVSNNPLLLYTNASTTAHRNSSTTISSSNKYNLDDFQTFYPKNFDFLKADGKSLIPHRLPPSSVIKTFENKLKFNELIPFEDKENLWWKSSYIHAFLQSFETGELMGILELDKFVFGKYPIRQDLIKEALTYERSWLEQGTEFSRPLGMMRGSKRKIRPQKGTGRSRQGNIRRPQFVGGYRPHGPRPHDKSKDIDQSCYSHAVRHALSTKFSQEQIMIVDRLSLSDPSDDALYTFLSSKYWREVIGKEGETAKLDHQEEDLEFDDMLRAVYENQDGLLLEDESKLKSILIQDYSKSVLIDQMKNLGLYGRRVYFLFGNADVESQFISAADAFEKQKKTLSNIWGEKEVIVCDARNISILPLMSSEMLVVDKYAIEVLEELYSKN